MKPLCLTALLLVVPFAAHGKAEPILLKPITLTLSVDAQGKPSKVACAGSVAEPICSILVRAVSGWKFTPGKVANVDAAMDGRLTLTMEATPRPSGYGLRGLDAFLETAFIATRTKRDPETRPRYPEEEQRRGKTARVVVEVWPQPEGKPPRVGNVWVNGKAAGHGNPFAKATIESSKSWMLITDPTQRALCIVVDYSLGRRPPEPSHDTRPCKPTFVEGYALPVLLTDVTSAVF